MMRGTFRAVGRGVGVVCLTAIEVTALSVWLGLVGDAAELAPVVVGVGALAAGLLVEGLLTHLTVNGLQRPVPALSIAGLAAVETLLWVGWLGAIRVVGEYFGFVTDYFGMVGDYFGAVAAGFALAAALVVRHTVADNAFRSRHPLTSLVGRSAIGVAVVEAAGATGWFLVVSGAVAVPEWVVSVPVAGFSPNAVVGAALLAGAVFVRQLLAVRHALQTRREVTTTAWRSSGTLWEY